MCATRQWTRGRKRSACKARAHGTAWAVTQHERVLRTSCSMLALSFLSVPASLPAGQTSFEPVKVRCHSKVLSVFGDAQDHAVSCPFTTDTPRSQPSPERRLFKLWTVVWEGPSVSTLAHSGVCVLFLWGRGRALSAARIPGTSWLREQSAEPEVLLLVQSAGEQRKRALVAQREDTFRRVYCSRPRRCGTFWVALQRLAKAKVRVAACNA